MHRYFGLCTSAVILVHMHEYKYILVHSPKCKNEYIHQVYSPNTYVSFFLNPLLLLSIQSYLGGDFWGRSWLRVSPATNYLQI